MEQAVDGVPTHLPGSDGYVRATTPLNTVARQHPALVAAPTDVEQVAACVRHAARTGLRVVPQATGHGAAGELGDDVLLLDTSGLDTVAIDAEHRSARVGAGCRWGAVNAEAFRHGLLGRSGSSPTVGVAGFTFGAGAGWLTRPWGLASGALTAVDYVDGAGAIRRAEDGAADQLDRDVIWACRGGGGVGIAVALEFDLVPVSDLWAGYLLWPLDALEAVVAAWSDALPRIGPGLDTSLAILQAPPSPLIPEPLHGTKVVHLALASTTGAADAEALFAALTAAPRPAIDTWAPADVERLGQVHLDPPDAVPAPWTTHRGTSCCTPSAAPPQATNGWRPRSPRCPPPRPPPTPGSPSGPGPTAGPGCPTPSRPTSGPAWRPSPTASTPTTPSPARR